MVVLNLCFLINLAVVECKLVFNCKSFISDFQSCIWIIYHFASSSKVFMQFSFDVSWEISDKTAETITSFAHSTQDLPRERWIEASQIVLQPIYLHHLCLMSCLGRPRESSNRDCCVYSTRNKQKRFMSWNEVHLTSTKSDYLIVNNVWCVMWNRPIEQSRFTRFTMKLQCFLVFLESFNFARFVNSHDLPLAVPPCSCWSRIAIFFESNPRVNRLPWLLQLRFLPVTALVGVASENLRQISNRKFWRGIKRKVYM